MATLGSGGRTSVEGATERDELVDEVLNRLRAAMAEQEEDELPPTEQAETALIGWLSGVATSASSLTQSGVPYVESRGDGAIYLEWRGARRHAVALIAPEGAISLHKLVVDGGSVVDQEVLRNPTTDESIATLNWFVIDLSDD